MGRVLVAAGCLGSLGVVYRRYAAELGHLAPRRARVYTETNAKYAPAGLADIAKLPARKVVSDGCEVMQEKKLHDIRSHQALPPPHVKRNQEEGVLKLRRGRLWKEIWRNSVAPLEGLGAFIVLEGLEGVVVPEEAVGRSMRHKILLKES